VGRDGRLTRTWFSLPDCTISDPSYTGDTFTGRRFHAAVDG